jgi:hypothetical protein
MTALISAFKESVADISFYLSMDTLTWTVIETSSGFNQKMLKPPLLFKRSVKSLRMTNTNSISLYHYFPLTSNEQTEDS